MLGVIAGIQYIPGILPHLLAGFDIMFHILFDLLQLLAVVCCYFLLEVVAVLGYL